MEKELTNKSLTKLLTELVNEVKSIKKIIILGMLKDQQQKDAIPMLSGFGYQPKEIAELLGTTSNTVRVTLSRLKKDDKQKVDSIGEPNNE